MSFISDKKQEHEKKAEKALIEKDYKSAFFNTAKAAEYGLVLAEQSEGKIAQKYIEDAYELIEIATQLKAKVKIQAEKPDTSKAVKNVEGVEDVSDNQWELKEKPDEKLDDVAGLDNVKQELREKVIEPFLHPELYERFKVQIGGGILMYGPPGNGKTYIAKAIAGELDAAFFNVNTSQVKDKYVGETEKNMQRLFDAARKHERAVIFLDEVDHLLGKRGNRKIGSVAMFLSLTDGLVENTNCLLVLAATNKPWMLEDAVLRPGRLGTHIYVGPPDQPAREAILKFNMKGVPDSVDVSYEGIAKQTDGYSGADIKELCDRAKRAALRRQKGSGTEEFVSMIDFTEALQIIKPSVTPEMIKQFEEWGKDRDVPPGSDTDEE